MKIKKIHDWCYHVYDGEKLVAEVGSNGAANSLNITLFRPILMHIENSMAHHPLEFTDNETFGLECDKKYNRLDIYTIWTSTVVEYIGTEEDNAD